MPVLPGQLGNDVIISRYFTFLFCYPTQKNFNGGKGKSNFKYRTFH